MPDNIPGNTNTNATLTPGVPYSASIAPDNDHDWFKIRFVKDHDYIINVQSTANDAGEGLNPSITLRDYNGGWKASDYGASSSNSSSNINYTADYTGKYYVDVGSYLESSSGAYSVLVTDVT